MAYFVNQMSLLLRKIDQVLIEFNFFLCNLLLEFAEILELFAGGDSLRH